MIAVQQVLELLWLESETIINGIEGKPYKIVFSRPQNFFDVVMVEGDRKVGFITLKYEGDGVYSIVNETKKNFHTGFINTPGHGIEVSKEYRKRGVGKALLSIGIGLVQRDWQQNRKKGRFTVVASDVTASGLGCYRNFGFIVREGMAVTHCHYMESENVPELCILDQKASFWKRLKMRLHLGK